MVCDWQSFTTPIPFVYTSIKHAHVHTRTQFHTIAIIAEGIPENHTKKLIKTADEKKVTIIGPATVRELYLLYDLAH